MIELLPEIFSELRGRPAEEVKEGSSPPDEDFYRAVWGLRKHLQTVWTANLQGEREWYIHEMRRLYVHHARALANPQLPLLRSAFQGVAATDEIALEPRPFPSENQSTKDNQDSDQLFRNIASQWLYVTEPPPPSTMFEKVMFHFQQIAYRARRCANRECAAPFYFVKRIGQVYCTPDCAVPAQRKSKSEWWARNREDQIKKRRQKRQQMDRSPSTRKL
jgi:hypothetical protein